MGNTLTGQVVAETYDSLLKVTDNNQITGTKKRLTDGFGTDTPLLVSTTDVQVDGNFLIESAQFNTATIQTGGVGKLIWNDQDGTLDLGLKGGNVTLQVGQEQVIRVVNKKGSNLLEANYQVVRVDGAQDNRLKVALAQANNDANSAETLGLVTETINDNQEGFITTSGLVRNINTTGSLQGETWADGDMLYLSGTTAGKLTNIKPTAPTHTVIMGYVVSAHATQGQIYVKVDNGYELDELHNVSITTPTDGQVLAYESATGLWKNTSNGNVGGSGTTNYISKWSSSTALTNSIIYDDGSKVAIGSTSPVALLDVYDSVLLKGLRVGRIISGSWLNEYSADAHIFQTGSASEKMRITSAGNIGIGTSTPSTKLDVNGDITSSGLIYSNLINSTFTVGSKLGLPVLGSSPSADPVYHSLHSTNENELTWLQPSSIGGDSPSTFKAVNTAARVYTFPDATGTVALTSNINSAISGTTNYLSKFTGSNSIGNSQVFDNGTNVGIGTASPSEKLSVVGGNISLGAGYKLQYSSTAYITPENNVSGAEIATGGILTIKTGGTSERVRVDSSGNVGIGTTSPSSILEVAGSAPAITINRTSGTSTATVNFNAGSNFGSIIGNSATGEQRYSIGPSAGWGGFHTFYTDTTERMRITSGGNVGIGTTSVFSKFQVHDGKIQVSPASNADGGGSIYGFNDTSRGFTFEGGLRFQTFNWNGSSYAMRDMMTISGGGNVGIGTTSPAYPLQVNGLISSNRTSNTDGGLVFGTPANGNYFYGADSGNYIAAYTANSERMRITSGGNVGIGTSSPVAKLSAYQGSGLTADAVISTQHAQSTGTQFATHINFLNSSGSQAGFISANGTATFYGTSSDYRLKKDLKDYSGLSLVGNIKTYDYQWESDESRMYGVLAHELAEVLPYAVNGEKDGEMMQGVDYSKIVPVLVKAIQEQQAQIEELKAKIN